MAKKPFDLNEMVDRVSKYAAQAPRGQLLARSDSEGPRAQMIPLDDILGNKANFYRVDKDALKPLADSIAMDRLQQFPGNGAKRHYRTGR